MNKLLKSAVVALLMMTSNPHSALAAGNGSRATTRNFDWNPVMEAIIEVESNGNHRAKNGNQVGAMQITPILVEDCNEILKQRKSGHHPLQDHDRFFAIHISLLFQCSHNLLVITLRAPYIVVHAAVPRTNGLLYVILRVIP